MNRWMVVVASALALNVSAAEKRPAAAADKRVALTVKKLPSVRLGLTAYGGADAAAKDAELLRTRLGEVWGRDVTPQIFADYDSLAAALAQGKVDAAWMQPFAYVAAEKQGKVTPLVKMVRHGMPYYRGVLFARADKGITNVAGLARRTIAWVEPKSAAGHLFPRAALIQAGQAPSKLGLVESFAGDHKAVCQAVASGKADVGATFADDRGNGQPMQVDGCVQSLGAEEAKKLAIILKSPPIPNDTIAVRPGYDVEDADKLKSALLGMKQSDGGRELLTKVFKGEGFEEVAAEDFEPVRYAVEAAGSK
jgi:phosphonate transport system substrate-binding protein